MLKKSHIFLKTGDKIFLSPRKLHTNNKKWYYFQPRSLKLQTFQMGPDRPRAICRLKFCWLPNMSV